MKDKLLSFLRDLEAHESVALLQEAEFSSRLETGLWGEPVRSLVVSCPRMDANALEALSPGDRQRIVDAWMQADSSVNDVAPPDVEWLSFQATDSLESRDPLLAELIMQRGLMIDVATGGPRFNDVDDYFKARQRRISRLLQARAMSNPVEFSSLWDWYGYWTENGLTSYSDRRHFVYDLFRPTIQSVLGSVGPPPTAPRPPTGWDRVDRGIVKAREHLAEAQDEEDFQAIGLYCREILISLGQAVFDAEAHETLDGVEASQTDAKRQLEAFLAATVPGRTNETVRRHAKAAVALALDLQHRRTADRKLARLCLEATASAAAVVSILCDRF